MKNIKRNGVIFNALSGTVNSLQSVVWLMFITRILGINEAGIFTIAYAIANLLLLIGRYGVRDYQASDVNKVFTWSEYYVSRLISTAGMMSVTLIYCLYMGTMGGYSVYKVTVVFLMTLLKAADAYEDVYHGMYQQRGRLDIAGLSLFIRLGGQMLVFSVMVLCGFNLAVTLIITNLFTWPFVIIVQRWWNKKLGICYEHPDRTRVKNIYIVCSSIFFSSFISFYIGNLSKYKIDALMSEQDQAYYGFISMPIFVVALLANFIYQPILKDMSVLWNEYKIREFLKKIGKALLLILGVSVGVLGVGYLFGIWGLELLYGIELERYKTEFMILLLGSGLFAVSSFFRVVLIVMRKQKIIFVSYVILWVIAEFMTVQLVKGRGIYGAAVSYAVSMCISVLMFIVIIVYSIRKQKGNESL